MNDVASFSRILTLLGTKFWFSWLVALLIILVINGVYSLIDDET